MGVPVNNTLVRHAVFLAADTLPRVLIIKIIEMTHYGLLSTPKSLHNSISHQIG